MRSREESNTQDAIESIMNRLRSSVRSDAEIEARRNWEQEERRKLIDTCLLAAGFPKRAVAIRKFKDERWLQAEELLTKSVIDGGGTWLLVGGRGNGKSTMAACAARAVIAKGGRVRFAYLPETLDMMRADATAGLRRVGALDLLVIDEVTGEAKLTGWQRDALTSVVRKRHDNEQPTIMTSNATKSAALQRLGATIASRLAQGGVIVADWPSFRHASGTTPRRGKESPFEI